MKNSHSTTGSGVQPESEDDEQVRLIPIHSSTTEEVAQLLKTNSNSLRKVIAKIQHRLGQRIGKWSVRQVAMIVEHWGSPPPKDKKKAA